MHANTGSMDVCSLHNVYAVKSRARQECNCKSAVCRLPFTKDYFPADYETSWISKAFVVTLARWRMMTQHLLAQEMDSIEMVDGADPRG